MNIWKMINFFQAFVITVVTRLHSSRMRTARALTVSHSMLGGGGVCSGGSAPGGVCSGASAPGGVSAPRGVSALGGPLVCLLL